MIVKVEYVPMLAGSAFVTLIFGGFLFLILFSDFSQISVQHPIVAFAAPALSQQKEETANAIQTVFETKQAGINLLGKKRIVLRMDNVQDSASETQILLIKRCLDQNLALTIGVIPSRIGKNKVLVAFLLENSKSGKLEIVQHGWDHSVNEFKDLNYSQALERIKKGREKFANLFGKYPTTFIPPYNEYNQATLDAIANLNFSVVSAGSQFKKEGNVFAIGQSVSSKEYSEDSNGTLRNPVTVIEQCKKSLEYDNHCVFTFHPRDYDSTTLQSFDAIISGLQQTGAEFVTFEQLATRIN